MYGFSYIPPISCPVMPRGYIREPFPSLNWTLLIPYTRQRSGWNCHNCAKNSLPIGQARHSDICWETAENCLLYESQSLHCTAINTVLPLNNKSFNQTFVSRGRGSWEGEEKEGPSGHFSRFPLLHKQTCCHQCWCLHTISDNKRHLHLFSAKKKRKKKEEVTIRMWV